MDREEDVVRVGGRTEEMLPKSEDALWGWGGVEGIETRACCVPECRAVVCEVHIKGLT